MQSHIVWIYVVRIGVACLFALIVFPLETLASNEGTTSPVVLHYIQRPPYMVLSKDGLAGLTGAPSFQAFKRAGISFEIKETPFARQLRLIESNAGLDCMIGMFKKPEREVYARYTKPIYHDQTQLILTSSANAHRVAKYATVEDLFGDKTLVFLAKLGYSYGASLDARIDSLKPVIRTTADENLMMVKAIQRNMADYMVMAPEEAYDAITAAGFNEGDFKLIRLRNMPAGEFRHIMCSKNVSEDLIKKLNAAIPSEK